MSQSKLILLKLPWYRHALWLLIYAISTFVDVGSSSEDEQPTSSRTSNEDKFFKGLPILYANFEFIAYIGEGSSGKVIKAKHRHDKKIYAIKCMPLDDMDENISDAREEAELLSSLKHKNVVSYNFSWIDNMHEPHSDENNNNNSSQQSRRWFCILMEYCETTLGQVIRNNLFRDPNNKLEYFYQIVEGLAYVHSKGLVHADLTPDNILVDSEGCVKIADFGTSTIHDNPYCKKGDMKDLGVILNEMFQGALQRTEIPMASSSADLADAFDIFRWIQKPHSERPTCVDLLTFRHAFCNKICRCHKPFSQSV